MHYQQLMENLPLKDHPAPARARALGSARPDLPALAHAWPGRCPQAPPASGGQRPGGRRPQEGGQPFRVSVFVFSPQNFLYFRTHAILELRVRVVTCNICSSIIIYAKNL